MADKGKMHSAGIFADMTVDGPEIGTLVIIVDRAKNLPNRKSIGKQDPYCAARLGKEAKKTETDKRGGQTPKWDQELRFTVHDSPDYYQLKVSVFNDDKKTDLIGETWINLQDVLVPGGGQNDLWHNLNYRGKYAGEIRIEITYYDTRPKQEKPRERVREGTANVVEGGRESLGGPRGLKEKVKRRPLPSDPTGATPSPIETPERALPQQPRGYANVTPDQQPRGYPAVPPDYAQNQKPLAYSTADHVLPLQQKPYASPEHVQAQPPRTTYNTPPTYIQTQSPLQNLEYNTPPHARTQSQQVQGRYGPSGMDQSPLQTDYNTPPPHGFPQSQQSQNRHASPAVNGYGQSPGMLADKQHPRDMYDDRYDGYGQPREDGYTGSNVSGRYEDSYIRGRSDARQGYAPQQATYDLPPPDEYEPPPSPGGPPPPPPVHRVHQSSATTASSPGYGFPPNPPRETQFDHLRQDHHRHSMPGYTQTVPHQPYTQQYSPSPAIDQISYNQPDQYQETPPKHHSYDDRYNSSFNSMQPTVEDAPPSPSPFNSASHRKSEPHMSQHGDRRYDDVPSPAPLNLSGRGSAASGIYNANANAYNTNAAYTVNGHRQADPYYEPSPSVSKDYGRQSYNQDTHQAFEQRWQPEEPVERSPGGFVPSLPPTLVAGMDPLIAQEISDRIYSVTRPSRDSYSQFSSATVQRHSEPPQQFQPPSQYREDARTAPFVPASGFAPQVAPSDRQSRGIPSTYTAVVKPRAISPNPSPSPSHSHTVHRKSVSPAPPSPSPSASQPRRLSAVPFGPDDYTALNPNAPAVAASVINSEMDRDAKIIMHDGREIDPSDHLPEASWAALPPNLKKSFDNGTPTRESRSRPSPGGAQPMPPSSGRRMERRDGRPQSSYMPSEPTTPGRNRLQKKANRMSTQPAAASSPLSPISANHYQSHPDPRDSRDSHNFAPRSLPRAHTVDFATEDGYGAYSNGSPGAGGGYRDSQSHGPPLPAKVPLVHSHSGGGAQMHGAPQENAWALLEEMKSIDLGNGRARRRKGGAIV